MQDKRINSMSIPLPSATVTVVGVGLGSKAAGFTNKNPDFPFLQLDPIQGGVFLFASSAGFGLHGRKVDLERLSFPINADGRTFRNDNGSGGFRTQVGKSLTVHRGKVTIDEGLQNIVDHPPGVMDAVFL